jgi:hypothetical protein
MKKHILLIGLIAYTFSSVKAQRVLPANGNIPVNTAIIPVPKLEEDSYNWWDRHAQVIAIKDSINPEILLIGDSITHFWGGLPQLKYTNGQLRQPNGPTSWNSLFGPYRVLNLGFGWDRTQNVLWRLDHGEIDGLSPEIVDGIAAICARVRAKMPKAKIILMAVFPREENPNNPRRALISQINRQLKVYANDVHITFVNIGPEMLNADGAFLPGMMLDFTHPTDKGYQVWANAIRPYLKKYIH